MSAGPAGGVATIATRGASTGAGPRERLRIRRRLDGLRARDAGEVRDGPASDSASQLGSDDVMATTVRGRR